MKNKISSQESRIKDIYLNYIMAAKARVSA